MVVTCAFDKVGGSWCWPRDGRYAPEEATFRDAVRVGQIAAAGPNEAAIILDDAGISQVLRFASQPDRSGLQTGFRHRAAHAVTRVFSNAGTFAANASSHCTSLG